MSRVYDAFRRAAEEQKKDSAAKLQDAGGVDTIAETFPAEVPFERLVFTGQQMPRSQSSPARLLAVATDAAPEGVADLVSDRTAPTPEGRTAPTPEGRTAPAPEGRPAPQPEGKGDAASAPVARGPQAASEASGPTQVARKRAGGSFEDLLRDIARDERRLNL